MAAVIELVKTYGSSGSPTTVVVTSPGLLSEDSNASPIAAPVRVPAAGTEYSYECWLQFRVNTAPDNLCNNFQIWSSGVAVGTGMVITVNSDAVDTYVTPVDTDSAAGSRVDFADKDSGDKIDIDGDLVNVSDTTDFMVFQLEIDNTAEPGNKSYTVYFSFDES